MGISKHRDLAKNCCKLRGTVGIDCSWQNTNVLSLQISHYDESVFIIL